MDSELRNEDRPASPTQDASVSAPREENAEASGGVRVATPAEDEQPAIEETPPAETVPAPVTPLPLDKRIKAMKDEQSKLKADKAKVTKELKVMEKKRSRLKKRARQLSDGDLLEVLHMRKTSKVEKEEVPAPADGEPRDASAASAGGV